MAVPPGGDGAAGSAEPLPAPLSGCLTAASSFAPDYK